MNHRQRYRSIMERTSLSEPAKTNLAAAFAICHEILAPDTDTEIVFSQPAQAGEVSGGVVVALIILAALAFVAGVAVAMPPAGHPNPFIAFG